MGKDCTSCLPCQQGLPCLGGHTQIRRITNFGGDCTARFVQLSQDTDWKKFSEAVEDCSASQDMLSYPFNEQLENLGKELRSDKICYRIYLNRAVDILAKGRAVHTLAHVYPRLAEMRKKALIMAGVSVLGGSYLLKEHESSTVNMLVPAAMVFSGLYLARTYNKL